jgi:hypothetical protein
MNPKALGWLRDVGDKLSERWSAASYNERLDSQEAGRQWGPRGLFWRGTRGWAPGDDPNAPQTPRRSRRLDGQSFNERLDRASRRR